MYLFRQTRVDKPKLREICTTNKCCYTIVYLYFPFCIINQGDSMALYIYTLMNLPLYLPTYLSACLPACCPVYYAYLCQPSSLSLYHPYMIQLTNRLFILILCLLANRCLDIHRCIYYLLTYLPAYLSTYLAISLSTALL